MPFGHSALLLRASATASGAVCPSGGRVSDCAPWLNRPEWRSIGLPEMRWGPCASGSNSAAGLAISAALVVAGLLLASRPVHAVADD